MIEELQFLVDDFAGKANQTCCFDHVLNLVAKTITKVFDARKKRGEMLGDDGELLEALVQDIELEEDEIPGDEDEEDDNVEGRINEQELLSDEERKRLNDDLVLIRLVIVKVCPSSPLTGIQLRKLAYKIVNSSTKLLPAWKSVLHSLKMAEWLMPRDV